MIPNIGLIRWGISHTSKQEEANFHDTLVHYQGNTGNAYTTIIQQTITDGVMLPDTWYTVHFWARGAGDQNSVGHFTMYFYANGSDQRYSDTDGVDFGKGSTDTHADITLTPAFKHFVITFHTPKNFSGGHTFWIRNDPEDNAGTLYCDVWHPKLELGQHATDFSVAPADMATVTALSSIEQTVNGIQNTVSNPTNGLVAKQTLLANQYTSVIGGLSNENLIPYSGYWENLNGWMLMAWGATDRNLNLTHHNFYHNGTDTTLVLGTTQHDTAAAGSIRFSVKPNTKYTFSFSGFASSNVIGTNVYFLCRQYGSTKDYDTVHGLFNNLVMSPSGINRYTTTFTTGQNDNEGYIRLDNIGSSNGASSGAYFAELKLELGTVATPYTRNSSTEMIQTASEINMRVTKNGVVNAVNVSPEGIQIYGNKLHITSSTYIDNAIIKSAMIDTITADKITAGTLNGNNVNVINLNASHITTGTLSGSNLQINLNTGVVAFRKGRIHNSSNTIDINIDSGYMSVANNNARVIMKEGEIQLVEPTLFDNETSPYLKISNAGGGAALFSAGGSFIGRDYAVITNSANWLGAFDAPIGVEEFSGLATGKSSGGWGPTKVAGAERGVVISGGMETTFHGGTDSSPHISIGTTNTMGNTFAGNRIAIWADYVHIYSAYDRTTSASPNVFVAQDGALVRSTSASKYKTNIVRGRSVDYGEKLIQLPTATWIDKASLQRYNDDPSQPMPGLNYGMIAEDLAAAGLEHLIVRNEKGGLEGIQYDRIAVALLPLLSKWKQTIDNQEQEINELKEKVGNI
ncbi:gp58-like family protein [Lactiplantibacillus pentosus]|uniref:gp58-like family protein n=1 Tax=Lactiplantibacillus pentosus TaxID=1589 RepID=UPI003D2EF4A8